MSASEIIFDVSEDETDGGYSASALGYGIHTQGDSVEEIRRNVRAAVDCYFDETTARPRLIRFEVTEDETDGGYSAAPMGLRNPRLGRTVGTGQE